MAVGPSTAPQFVEKRVFQQTANGRDCARAMRRASRVGLAFMSVHRGERGARREKFVFVSITPRLCAVQDVRMPRARTCSPTRCARSSCLMTGAGEAVSAVEL